MKVMTLCPTGAAYGRAETVLREFVEMSDLPFLPTPMGKGVLPDDHPNCVAAARSRSATLSKLHESHRTRHLAVSFEVTLKL